MREICPLCESLIAAWSPNPPRVPTYHSAVPQIVTNSSGVKFNWFIRTNASADTTTKAEELPNPAAIGIFPATRAFIPLNRFVYLPE